MVSHEAAKDEFQTIATLRVDIMEGNFFFFSDKKKIK